MSSIYERRDNGDGSYSTNTAITDSDAIIPVDLKYHGMNGQDPLIVQRRFRRIVLSMQGTTIAAGATLSQAVDLSGADKAIFGAVFSTALTGSMGIYNSIGNLWVGSTSTTLTAATSGQTASTFIPIAEVQKVTLSNTGSSGVAITTAEVIAQ
jgi:hypothetical protein